MTFKKTIILLFFITVSFYLWDKGIIKEHLVTIQRVEGAPHVEGGFRLFKHFFYRDMPLYQSETLVTESDETVDVGISRNVKLRIKPESRVRFKRLPTEEDPDRSPSIVLLKGRTLVSMNEFFQRFYTLRIRTPQLKIETNRALFGIEVHEDTEKVSVLRGTVHVQYEKEVFILKELEAGFMDAKGKFVIQKMGQSVWKEIYEAYILIPEVRGVSFGQDLMLEKIGGFFDHVERHGVYYEPSETYFRREFFKDIESQYRLELLYDVTFSKSALAGIYFKFKETDAAFQNRISFEIRSKTFLPSPALVRSELKDASGDLLAEAEISDLGRKWKKVQLETVGESKSSADELVIFVSGRNVGRGRQGLLEVRNLSFS